MTLLDRYIAKLYLTNIVALSLALGGFVIGVDVFLNLGEFVEAAEAAGAEGGLETFFRTAYAVADLWWPRLLQLFTYLSGFVLITAMGFTAVNLTRRRELVAALAGGISLHRLIRPFLIVALGVTALQIVDQELVIPRIAEKLPRAPEEAGRPYTASLSVRLVRDGSGRLWHAAEYDHGAATMRGLDVWERGPSGEPLRRVRADEAVWREGERAWALTGGLASEPGGRSEPIERIETDLTPTLLLVKRVEGFGQNLSWGQIGGILRGGEDGSGVDDATRRRLETVRSGRVSMMVSNLLVLLIASPFFLLRQPRGMLEQALKCAPVAGIGLMGATLGSSVSLPGLPVSLGVATPVLVLVPVAIAAMLQVKT